MAEQLYFQTAIEATFHNALGKQLTPAFRAKLKAELDLDLERLRPAYPVDTMVRAVRLAQAELYPQLPSEESEERLGAQAFQGFASTLIGRAIVQVTRLMGPERTLPRMTHNMKAGVNFMEFQARKLGPGKHELETPDIGGLPYFYKGMFLEGLGATGARDLEVLLAQTDGRRALYRISWTPS